MNNAIRLDRRRWLGASATLAAIAALPMKTRAASPEAIDLWPGQPPGGSAPPIIEAISHGGSLTGITRPRLMVYRPAQPNGLGVVVIPGGGYAHISAGHEGIPTCQWLAGLGVTAFELIYRLPGNGWPAAAPFQDGQRALRLVRSRASAFGLTHFGVLGFSAGGHLAGLTAVQPDVSRYPAVDAADAASARPDFAGLIYPVISLLPPLDGTRSHKELLGSSPDLAAAKAMSVEQQVTRQAPPMFLAQAADDPISPVQNSFVMAAALRQAGVPVELHVFQSGGHGWGLGRAGSEPAAWPGLFAAWLRQNGVLPRPPDPT